MQRIKIITGVLFTILLWHIGFWIENQMPFPFTLMDLPGKFYENWLIPFKTEIGIFAGVLVLVIQLIGLRNPFKLRKKKILNAVQNHYINDKFKGNIDDNRITIFKAKMGYRIYPLYFRKCIFNNRKLHREKGLLKFYLYP
jgi:uncharacterized membrane protein